MLIIRGGDGVEISFDADVEKLFDWENGCARLKKKIGAELARAAKLRINQMKASETFWEYLAMRLGKPHVLSGDLSNCYAVSVSANFRLIIAPQVDNFSPEILKCCKKVVVKGVVEYHGGKNEWIVP